MDYKKIDLEKTNRFSSFFIDYLKKKEGLLPFYGLFPEVKNFKKQIEIKSSFDLQRRTILVKALQNQNQGLDISAAVNNNIEALANSNTFTITTGHQLNIFTGPLYFIFKIVTVIKAAEVLKKAFPDFHFVPVYWMATEDHDFEEINNFRLDGKKYTWHSTQKGAVGRFNLKSFNEILKSIPGLPEFFKDAYSKSNLTEAVRHYVNHIFGNNGLVIIDGDDKDLKASFTRIIKDDVLCHTAKTIVSDTSSALDSIGYKSQIFPRDINFFYLKEQLRERIEKVGDHYQVLDTDITFTRSEMEKEIEEHPERFSPNVVLRPLYEESLLPNLAYCGGPAEVVYWLQLKSTFEHYKIPYPILIPRNFGMVIPEKTQKKLEKTKLPLEDLFLDKPALFKKLILDKRSNELLLNDQRDAINELFLHIQEQAASIDPTLSPHVEAQKVKTLKKLDVIEKKFIRAEKRNQADRLQQIESIMDFLFPNGGLQERTDNFLNFYIGNPSFIEDLMNTFDPFDYRFHILNYGK